MAQETLAPWAEIVPDAPYPMTVDDVLALPDDEWMYELVEGRLVRMPPGGGEAGSIDAGIVAALYTFVVARGLGRVTGPDTGYVLKLSDGTETMFAPDAAFVRSGRYPPKDSPEFKRPWHVAPDLAVEVVSPHQYRPGLAAKARAYLDAGVRLVWIVWPGREEVDVWSGSSDEPVQTLRVDDHLDGLDVLPGFTYPVSRLFE